MRTGSQPGRPGDDLAGSSRWGWGDVEVARWTWPTGSLCAQTPRDPAKILGGLRLEQRAASSCPNEHHLTRDAHPRGVALLRTRRTTRTPTRTS